MILAAIVPAAAGATAFALARLWILLAAGLLMAIAALSSSVSGRWPYTRSVDVTAQDLIVREGAKTQSCERASIRKVVVAWSSGLAGQPQRRTRLDAWTVSCVGQTGQTLLSVQNAQDFGTRAVRRLAHELGVAVEAPDDWEAAQHRWSRFRSPAALG